MSDAALDAVRDAWLAQLVDDGVLYPEDCDAQGNLIEPSRFSLTISKAVDAGELIGGRVLDKPLPRRGAVALLTVKPQRQSAAQLDALGDITSAFGPSKEHLRLTTTLLAKHDDQGVAVILHCDAADGLLQRLNQALATPLTELQQDARGR